jgi:hypothetical protein
VLLNLYNRFNDKTKFIDILELIEVVNKKNLTQELDKLLRAHRGCLGFERRRRT